jgi:hypothetical protein
MGGNRGRANSATTRCGVLGRRGRSNVIMQTLRLSLQMALGIVLPLAVQLWDRRRLTAEQRDACWNGATWGAALYAFGPLSMLGWCWVTRGATRGRPDAHAERRSTGAVPSRWAGVRRLAAFALGVASTLTILAVIAAMDYLLALALGLSP